MNAFIYKTINYKESSLLLYCLTPNGKVCIIANGIKKINNPNRYMCDYLTLIECDESNKEMFNLSNPKLINDYKNLKQDISNLEIVSLIIKALDKCEILEYKDYIYNLLIKTLDSNNIKISTINFLLRLGFLQGYKLNLIADENTKGISISAGGFTSNNDIDLDITNSINLLNIYSNKDISLNDLELNILYTFIKKYYEYYLNIKL